MAEVLGWTVAREHIKDIDKDPEWWVVTLACKEFMSGPFMVCDEYSVYLQADEEFTCSAECPYDKCVVETRWEDEEEDSE